MSTDTLNLLTPYFLDPNFKAMLGPAVYPKLFGKTLSALPVEPAIANQIELIPCEISPGEKRFLFNFFAAVWPGQHNVLEVGPLFGGSTRCIALGMLANPRKSSTSRYDTYDKFMMYYDKEHLATKLQPLFQKGILSEEYQQQLLQGPEYPDFYELFIKLHEESPYFPFLSVHNQSLPYLPEHLPNMDKDIFRIDPNSRYDAVFVDGCKSWYSTKYFMQQVTPHTDPGTYFIFQDYGWYTCFWLPVFVSLLSEYFEIVASIDTTYVFRLTKRLEPEVIDKRFPDYAETITEDLYDRLYNGILAWAAEHSDIRGLVFFRLQHAAALAYLDKKEKAKSLIEELAKQPYSLPHMNRIEAAMKSPCYKPPGVNEYQSKQVYL